MTLHVIDGNSLLFRAYYATSFTGNIMRRKDGFPTNAIFGFSNMITKIISSLKEGDLIFVSFDYGKNTFRSEMLKEYKAQRKPVEEDLKLQFPAAREMLKAMGIKYYEVEGYEGDDIAGTVAKNGSKQGIKTIMYTSDKDYLQLIDENIQVNMLKKGLSDIEVMTIASLKEKMGLTPDQIRDYKGLMGDPSDNLKGIPGVGEKTALKLIEQYGSLENILSAMENDNSKLAIKIIENKDLGILCKKMATIVTNMNLPFTLEDLKYIGYSYNELSSFYTKYECYSLIKKLDPNKYSQNKELNNSNINVEKIVISSFKEIKGIPEIIILDQEKGNYHIAQINGIVFALKGKTYYLPFQNAKKDEDFISYLKDEKKPKITYDSKALKVALSYFGIEVKGITFDLLLATYLLDSSLKAEPEAIFGYYHLNINLTSNEISLLNENDTSYYEAYYLENLYPEVLSKLKENNLDKLYFEIELPLSNILSLMEIEGVPVDLETLDKLDKEYKDKCEKLTKQIYSLAGHEFNISSPKQVADVLFRELGLPSNKKESTDIDVLNYLAKYHPIVPLIIEYRKYSKIISTYTSGLKNYIFKDNKIHTIFNQALTQTGRLSSSEPNLQNISARLEEGKLVRKAFFYPDNNYLLSLDYSQIEIRILAHAAKSQELIDSFNNNEDIHSRTAMSVFNKTKEELTPALRRKAKAVNFGIIYGISDWGLSEQISSSVTEAKEIITKFYERYPEIKNYFENIIKTTIELGYTETLFGRRRYIPEITSPNHNVREFGKRAAMNACIQGTGADIIKIAMIKVDEYLKKNNYKTKMILQIHDELIFKVPEEEKDIIPNILKNIMENCVKLNVKLQVEGSVGKSWYDCK